MPGLRFLPQSPLVNLFSLIDNPKSKIQNGEIYLHLPGVIVTEKAGQVRYLLGDGLGSIRQAVDGTGAVVAYNEFDPWGNPVQEGSQPYGFTGEWWQDEVELLHLRARWYAPEIGTFLSRDPVEWEPPYQYVRGNPVNYVDRSGACTGLAAVGPSIEVMLDEECIGGPASAASSPKNVPVINSSGAQTLIKTAVVVVINSCIYIINYFLDSEGKFVKVDIAPQTKVEVNPGPQTDPRLKPTAQCCPAPLPTATPQQYNVLVQVQGRGLRVGRSGISQLLQDTSPIRASAVIVALNNLEGRLSRRDLRLVNLAFNDARAWVRSVAAAGGVGPIGNTPFNNRSVSPNDARVDIQVNRGPINIVP